MSNVFMNNVECSYPQCNLPISEFLLDDADIYIQNMGNGCLSMDMNFCENENMFDFAGRKDSFYEDFAELSYKNMPHPVESLPDLEFNSCSSLSESLQMDSYKDLLSDVDSALYLDGHHLIQELTPLVEPMDANFDTFAASFFNQPCNMRDGDKILSPPAPFCPTPVSFEDALINKLTADAAVVVTGEGLPDIRFRPSQKENFEAKPQIKRSKAKKSNKKVTVDDLDQVKLKKWLEPIPVPPRRVRDPRPHEFLLRMLRDECYQLINWEDRNRGVFRLVDEKLVSKIWGKRRTKNRLVNSKDLKYDHFARNIRYHYHKDFLPVKEQKVYQFTPKILKAWEAGTLNA